MWNLLILNMAVRTESARLKNVNVVLEDLQEHFGSFEHY
jgi:hypothetical protein